MKHPDPHKLSALLDGDLTSQEVREMEMHLGVCRACSELLEELAEIRTLAGELPDRVPPRDLWPEISQAIRGVPMGDRDVIRLHPSAPVPARASRGGFRLSVPQAVAAGLALAFFSGVLGARLGQEGPSPGVAVTEASWVTLVSEATPTLEGAAREVAQLEEALNLNRQELDSVTVGVLERNLAVIEEAIRESVAALKADPGNRFLEDNLQRAIWARRDYLRDAALAVGPRT